mmetsp:Transcript_47934/g.71384  ORF Transcript_47934/g.71384 Transcript_47934/m.71384 type:complete len:382 (-) Transcript_47934:246-1391(-)
MIEEVGLDIDGEMILDLSGIERGNDETNAASESSSSSSEEGSYSSSDDDVTDDDEDSDDSASSSYLDSSDEEELLEAMAAMDLTRSTQSMRRCWSADAISSQEYSSTQVSVLLNQIRNTNDLKPSPMVSVNQASSPTKSSTIMHSKAFGMPRKQPAAQRRASTISLPNASVRPGAVATGSSDEASNEDSMSPTAVLSEILLEIGESFSDLLCSDVENYFVPITDDRVQSYTTDVVSAIRNEDIDGLRRMHFDKKANLDCCNQFGESVLHTACRRNLPRVVDFLIHEAKVDLRVRDDLGRTPMHDACWAADFNKQLILLLVTEWPDLLFVKDKRGFTPLSYVRKSQWEDWRTFLHEHKELLLLRSGPRRKSENCDDDGGVQF